MDLTVLVVVVLVVGAIAIVLRRRPGLVSRRGMSIGADLGLLADAPRVRVTAVTMESPDLVRVVLTPEEGNAAGTTQEFSARLSEEEFGLRLLQEWQRSGSQLAMVTPPGTHLVRLRSVDDLQHLTLRRVDEP